MCNKSAGNKALLVKESVARVLAGDVGAYSAIYKVCDGPLRSFIWSRHGQLGRDFVSEVAIRTHEYAFSHLNNYRSDRGASFQTWLNWLSRNFAGHVRREWYNQRFVRYDQALHEAWTVTETGPADEYEETRLSRVLHEETESLPEAERQVIVLHDIEGLPHPACARATGLTYEQVRHRRRLALAALRRRLELRGVSPVPVDSTPAPIWYGEDRTDRNDGLTAPETALLPDGPDVLVGAAAKEEDEE